MKNFWNLQNDHKMSNSRYPELDTNTQKSQVFKCIDGMNSEFNRLSKFGKYKGLMNRFFNSIFILISSFSLSCIPLPELDESLKDLNLIRLLNNLVSDKSTGSAIGGSVQNLLGTGLSLRLELQPPGSDPSVVEDLSISAGTDSNEGTDSLGIPFQFQARANPDSQYQVSIQSQPSNPTQICEVAGGIGTVVDSDIENILVQCSGSLDVAQPSFSPAPGEFFTAVSVSISTSTEGASIYYTIDGSDPNCTGVGNLYASPVPIPQPSIPAVNLKAIACNGEYSSNLQAGDYRVTNGKIDVAGLSSSRPTNPPEPAYTTATDTTLAFAGTPIGATIHYTTNGSIPTCSSPSPPDPLPIASSMVVKAIVCAVDWTPSDVAEWAYQVTGTVSVPVFTLLGSDGPFSNDQNVGFNPVTPSGAEIRYELTTDGSNPPTPDCATSSIYSSPIPVQTNNTKIIARGCLADWAPSTPTGIETYNFTTITPGVSPNGGTFATPQTVTMTTGTTGANICYDPDGNAPSCNPDGTCASLAYTSPLVVSATSIIRAIACKNGYNSSAITPNALFTIDTTPPPDVTGLAIVQGNGDLTLNWTNPANNPVPNDFAGVKVLMKTGAFPANSTDGTLIFNGTGTTTTATGLTNETTYYFTVFSYDNVGNESAGGSGAQISSMPRGFGDWYPGYVEGIGAGGNVWSVAHDTGTGRMLIGGGFTSFHGGTQNRFVVLNPDGSIDTGFNTNLGAGGFNNSVISIAQHLDRLYIGGSFTSVGGQARNRIARVRTDGLIDPLGDFAIGSGFDGNVNSIDVKSDGSQILVGGNFTAYDGNLGIERVIVLKPDGNIEGSVTAMSTSGEVFSAVFDASGNILLGGNFTDANMTPRTHIARLSSTGGLDAAFNPNFDSQVRSIVALSDGKYIVGGFFNAVNANSTGRLVRLNNDGTLDNTFQANVSDGGVFDVKVQADGKIIIGGSFTMVNGVGRSGIARLHPDGTLDTSFDPGTGTSGSPNTVQSISIFDDRLLIGGNFTGFNGRATGRYAVLLK